MTAALNLLAVQNAPVLRALRDRPEGGWHTIADLADHLKRDRSNLSKTLNKLEDEKLAAVNPLTQGLTDAGAEQLAMIDRAERGGYDEPGSPADAGGVVFLTHAQILPDPANARRDWDSDEAREDLDSLRSDILQNGLLQNLVVRGPEADVGGVRIANGQGEFAPLYTLVGGERRWRAIGIAITDGDWEVDTPIPCRLLETDDLGHRLAALAENLQRRNLNPIEKANAFEGLAQAGLTNKEIADRVSSTPEHVQQHRRFLQLDADDQARMTLGRDDPRHLSVREARQKLARKDEPKAPPPPPVLNVSPAARLVMAEVIHRVRMGTYTWGDIVVGSDANDDPKLAELVAVGQLKPSTMKEYGDDVGHFTLSLAYDANRDTFPWNYSPDPQVRDEGLRAEQAAYADFAREALDLGGKTYATSWLNEPFVLTPDGEAARAEAERLDAEAEADEQRREAERQSVADAHAAVAARARQVFEQSRSTPPTPDLLKEIATLADSPLPWRVTHNGGVIAANGADVIHGGNRTNDRGEARMRLLVLAVNASGGFDTPADEPAPLPEPSPDIDSGDPDADVEDDA